MSYDNTYQSSRSERSTVATSGKIWKRKDGRWEARITDGYDALTGNPHRISIYGFSRDEVAKKLSETVYEINEGTYIEPSKMTINEWLDMWLEEFCGDKKPLTMQKYRGTLNKNVRPYIGSKRL